MNHLLMLVLLSLSLALSACGKKEEAALPKTSAEGVKQEAAQAIGAAEEQAKKIRDEFVSKAQQELNELNAKLAELKTKAQTLTGEAKVKIDQQIQNLEQEQKTAAQKLGELKSATSEKWNELKAGASEAVDRFKQAVKKTKEGS